MVYVKYTRHSSFVHKTEVISTRGNFWAADVPANPLSIPSGSHFLMESGGFSVSTLIMIKFKLTVLSCTIVGAFQNDTELRLFQTLF